MRWRWMIFFLTPLYACTTGGDDQPSPLPLPKKWNTTEAIQPPSLVELRRDSLHYGRLCQGEGCADSQDWWKILNDKTLNQLMVVALENNNDVKIARARLREARAQYAAATSALWPDVGLSAHAKRGNEGLISQNKAITLYDAAFDAAWEADIFGGKRREADAASALAEAQASDLEEVMQSLTAELARNYIDARGLMRQLATAELRLQAQEEIQTLIRSQYDAGLISASDIAAADAEFETQKARLPQLSAAHAAALNRINTLIGAIPGTADEWLAEPEPMPMPPDDVILTTPAEAIRLRPDVQRAERQLAAAAAMQDAARTELFPKLTLSGLFGFQDTSRFPSGILWSAAAGLAMPVVDFGRVEAGIDIADARQEQALAAYKQSVLVALEEVETTLSAWLNENARRVALTTATASQEEALDLAYERYSKGLAPFTETLAAEKELYAAEDMRIASEMSAVKNIVALYKALGGIIPPAPADASAPTVPPAPPGSDGKAPDLPNLPPPAALDSAVQ